MTTSETATQMWAKPYYKLVPVGECKFLKKNITEMLYQVLISLKVDKPKSVVWVGDACPRVGDCPGHPSGSHGRLISFDVDYSLFSGKGTQYAPAQDRENIWFDPGIVLDESKVDWWIIWQLLIRLKEYVPDINNLFIIHEKIFDLIAKNITNEDKNYLSAIVSKDTGTNYNHHTHMHLQME